MNKLKKSNKRKNRSNKINSLLNKIKNRKMTKNKARATAKTMRL